MKSVNPLAQQTLSGLGPAPMHAADLMGQLLKQVSRTIAAERQWGDLRASHYRLLTAVPAAGIRITELGEKLGMTTAASGQFVKYLVERGHLVVEVDSSDRRSRVASRTRKGDRAVVAITERIHLIEQEWADRVGQRRYRAFRAVLSELSGQ